MSLTQDRLEAEYPHKVYYYKTDFKGRIILPLDCPEFSPRLFIGTEEEFHYILDNYLRGREDEFKIIDWHRFDTYEEYSKAFPIKNFKG